MVLVVVVVVMPERGKRYSLKASPSSLHFDIVFLNQTHPLDNFIF